VTSESETSQIVSPASAKRLLTVGFVLLVPLVLLFDSRVLLNIGLNWQLLSDLLAPLYLLLLVNALRPEQRLAVLMFVPVAVVAENIFSLIFKLYTYKFDIVPPYVPFGHAILLGSGLLIAESPFVKRCTQQVSIALIIFHIAIIVAIIALGDSLSLIFELAFAVIIYRKRTQFLYLFMAIPVLYVELVGTALGCWFWSPTAFHWLHTTNPPLGAFSCYVIGDLLAIKITQRLLPVLLSISARMPFATAFAQWVGLRHSVTQEM